MDAADVPLGFVAKAIKGNTVDQDDLPEDMEIYIISIKTGDSSGSGTNGDVYITLLGDCAVSERIKLDLVGDDFTAGSSSQYVVAARDVGAVMEIALTVEKTLFVRNDKWFCTTVSVTERASGKDYMFYPNCFIQCGERMKFKLASCPF
jgi:hypothetical protein